MSEIKSFLTYFLNSVEERNSTQHAMYVPLPKPSSIRSHTPGRLDVKALPSPELEPERNLFRPPPPRSIYLSLPSCRATPRDLAPPALAGSRSSTINTAPTLPHTRLTRPLLLLTHPPKRPTQRSPPPFDTRSRSPAPRPRGARRRAEGRPGPGQGARQADEGDEEGDGRLHAGGHRTGNEQTSSGRR